MEDKISIAAGASAGDYLPRERMIEIMTSKIIALIKEYYDQPQLIKIDGKFGSPPMWIEWTGSDIGEYTFKVRVGSALHQNSAIKMQQKMQYLQLVMQFAQSGIIPNPQVIIQSLLTEIGDLQGINPEVIDQAFEQQQIPAGIPGEVPGQGGPAGGPGVSPVPSPEQTAPGEPGVNTPSPTANNSL